MTSVRVENEAGDYGLSRAAWRVSTYSANGSCVEVACNLPGIVAVRDSKDRGGPALAFSPETWRALLDGIRDGQFTR
jgi:hypothetical protein